MPAAAAAARAAAAILACGEEGTDDAGSVSADGTARARAGEARRLPAPRAFAGDALALLLAAREPPAAAGARSGVRLGLGELRVASTAAAVRLGEAAAPAGDGEGAPPASKARLRFARCSAACIPSSGAPGMARARPRANSRRQAASRAQTKRARAGATAGSRRSVGPRRPARPSKPPSSQADGRGVAAPPRRVRVPAPRRRSAVTYREFITSIP